MLHEDDFTFSFKQHNSSYEAYNINWSYSNTQHDHRWVISHEISGVAEEPIGLLFGEQNSSFIYSHNVWITWLLLESVLSIHMWLCVFSMGSLEASKNKNSIEFDPEFHGFHPTSKGKKSGF